jgi:hypothetical protein
MGKKTSCTGIMDLQLQSGEFTAGAHLFGFKNRICNVKVREIKLGVTYCKLG